MCMIAAQNKPKRSTHKPSSSMHHPLQVSLATNHPTPAQRTHITMTLHPINHPMEEATSVWVVVVLFCFFVWLPIRLSNLRTACSETLMLRERKASMADRSLSSLTGELLLLATAAAAFATFAARRLGGDGYPWRRVRENGPRSAIRWQWAVRGWVIVRVVVVWECRGGVWCEEVYQEAGIITRATEQHEQVTKGHTPRRGGRGGQGEVGVGWGQRRGEGSGAM